MSFQNDDDSDGLAALFGGITPEAGADHARGPRRSAPAPDPAPPVAQPVAQPVAPPPSAAPQAPAAPHTGMPQYPGLAEQPGGYPAPMPAAPAPQQPAAPMPSAPQSPAYQTAPPQMPAVPTAGAPTSPGYPGPGPAYDLPAPAAAPAPVAPAPGYPTGTPYPAAVPQSYDLPAPAAPPAGGPQYPGLTPQDPATGYPPPEAWSQPAWPGAAPVDPTPPPAAPAAPQQPGASPYPPPAQYPEAASQYAPPTQYPPATGYPPTPQYGQQPAAAPSVPDSSDGFAALGLGGEPTPLVPPGPFGAPPSPTASASYDLPAPSPAGAVPSAFSSSTPEPAAPASPHEQLVPAPAAPVVTAFPPGPLLPPATRPADIPDDIERSTTGEKVALVLALLTGPIGLLIAIITAARGARRRGWLIGVARASLALGVISTIVAAIGGVVYWNLRQSQVEHAQLAAASAEFCAAAAADPSLVVPPALGWPAPGPTITDSLALMQAWTDNWTALSATAPVELRAGLDLLAARGQSIIDTVTLARYVDDDANIAQVSAIQAQSGVAAWYQEYCA